MSNNANLQFGSVSKDVRTGKLGAKAILWIDGAYPSRYEFDTHGLSPADVNAKVAALSTHHEKKRTRLRGFAGVIGVEFVTRGRVFRIIDCTVGEASNLERVELYVDAVEVVGAVLRRLDGFPLRSQYSSIDEVPGNDQIVTAARAAVEDRVADEAAHQDFVARTSTILAGGE